MPTSMTGFGRAEATGGGVAATVETRSVNNRYLQVKTRLPGRYLRYEGQVEERVRKVLSRGTVDVFVRVKTLDRRDAPVVDQELARAYLRSIQQLAGASGLAAEVDLKTLLALPGVVTLEEPEEVDEREWQTVDQALGRALSELVRSRQGEGARLAEALATLLDGIEKVVRSVAARAEKVPPAMKRKLGKRIETLIGKGITLDAGALEREVALLADRADVTEELHRLASHVEGFRRSLVKKGPIGRSLDFLVQEMGREANTIGAKNQDVRIGRDVIELKTAIEKLREQVQNLE